MNDSYIFLDLFPASYFVNSLSAPEILTNQEYDSSADTYSYGIMLVYLIHCFPPYDDIEMDNVSLLRGEKIMQYNTTVVPDKSPFPLGIWCHNIFYTS